MAQGKAPAPSAEPLARVRQQPLERARRNISATLRALSGCSGIRVDFVAGKASVRGSAVRLPAPPRREATLDLNPLRGQADEAAFLLRHDDAAVHAGYRPQGEQARQAYDALASARVEALGAQRFAGAVANIGATLEHQAQVDGFARASLPDEIPLHSAIRLIARECFLGARLPGAATRAADLWRPELKKVGSHFDRLKEALGDASAYAARAIDLLAGLDRFTSAELACAKGQAPGTTETDEPRQGPSAQEKPAGDPVQVDQGGHSDGGNELETSAKTSSSISRYVQSFNPLAEREKEDSYRAFTTAFDEVVPAESLCGADELARLRARLDEETAQLRGTSDRLANRLQRKLQARRLQEWKFDLEEGMLDSSRLCRVVTSADNSLAFKAEQDSSAPDTVVTLLIDNSGSMRGRSIVVAAQVVELLARALERCAVKLEILGFTTRAWEGGQTRLQWIAAGKPRHPGRLNDLRHIIYKAAANPWRRARKNLGTMLKEDLLKENIDGEALLWAYTRLLDRPERRKILMVISDGAPIDDSTLSANGGGFLERHLCSVIEMIGKHGRVELSAIGIGHDVSRYYPRAVRVFDADELGGAVMREFTDLLAPDRRPTSRGRRDP